MSSKCEDFNRLNTPREQKDLAEISHFLYVQNLTVLKRTVSYSSSWMKEKQKNDLYLCHHCKSCCSTVPVMHRGGNNGDEYNGLFHRLSFPGHLILSSVFRTFPTELMITDCHIILLVVTCLGTCQKFYSLKTIGEKKCLLNSLLMIIIIYSEKKQ